MDLNGDGTVDLVVGNDQGNIKVWRSGWCEMLSTPEGGNLDELCTSATSGRCESVSGGYGGPRECSCSPGYATNGVYPGCSMCECLWSIFVSRQISLLAVPTGGVEQRCRCNGRVRTLRPRIQMCAGANDPVKCHTADTSSGSACIVHELPRQQVSCWL